jgi:hypothetical protein
MGYGSKLEHNNSKKITSKCGSFQKLWKNSTISELDPGGKRGDSSLLMLSIIGSRRFVFWSEEM